MYMFIIFERNYHRKLLQKTGCNYLLPFWNCDIFFTAIKIRILKITWYCPSSWSGGTCIDLIVHEHLSFNFHLEARRSHNWWSFKGIRYSRDCQLIFSWKFAIDVRGRWGQYMFHQTNWKDSIKFSIVRLTRTHNYCGRRGSIGGCCTITLDSTKDDYDVLMLLLLWISALEGNRL
jgi:hypothetical protein